jgi:striatin 1/3/4
MQQQSDSGQQSQQSQQPDYSLAGVLHFLQTEWRRYERDRNEWEIERAEMRVSSEGANWQQRTLADLRNTIRREWPFWKENGEV